ncbi:MAG TPA: cation:proton antiporter [Marmoricola sp.]|nr:cation:proton antiporter [Marmoricola sp.]
MLLNDIGPAPYLAVVLGVSVLAQWLAWQLKLPSILLLLLIGFAMGRLVSPEHVLGQDVLFGGVTIAVGIILFEGSLSLRLKHVADLGRPVIRLCTVTVAIAWPLITLGAWVIGFDIQVALLVGALLVVTGPTVIAPILRQLRPTRRVSSLLRWEGIVVDPIGAVLAVLVFQGVLIGGLGDALPQMLLALAKTLAVAFGIAFALGGSLEFLMRRHAIPDFLHGVAFLAAAVGALVGADALQKESGLVAVTVLGVYLGNRPSLHLEHVAEFKEHLQVLFVGGLFVILAGRVAPEQVWDVAPQALLLLVFLVAVVRPVSVLLGLAGTRTTREERALLACMAPRGIVAAAVTSIFALELHSVAEESGRAQLAHLADQASRMVPVVFLVIVGTVALYGLGVGRLAERLGLASTSPQGVLLVGQQAWVVQTATILEESGITTLVVSRNYGALSGARMSGLTTVTANILSDYAVRDMDLAGIGTLIACTDEDEVNATAAREFAHVLGRANVYQLRRHQVEDSSNDKRKAEAGHLTARFPFRPALSYADLEERVAAGMAVKRTKLSEEFTLDDFLARYGEDTVLMFAIRGSDVDVLKEDVKPPQTGFSVVALVRDLPPEEKAGKQADKKATQRTTRKAQPA